MSESNLSKAAPFTGNYVPAPAVGNAAFTAATAPELSSAEEETVLAEKTAVAQLIAATLSTAKSHADPNFCLSVPVPTKAVLANLLEIIERQNVQLAVHTELLAAVAKISSSADSCRRTAGDPDEDPDGYNAGFADATIGAASKLEAALKS